MTPYSKIHELYEVHPTATPDAFVLTRDQVFQLVQRIRSEAAKDARRRRETSSQVLRAFHNGGYCSFDQSAMCILDAANLTLGEYHAWRAGK